MTPGQFFTTKRSADGEVIRGKIGPAVADPHRLPGLEIVADLPAGLAFSTVAVLAYGCGSLRSARFASLFFGLCLINEPALITLPRSTTE